MNLKTILLDNELNLLDTIKANENNYIIPLLYFTYELNNYIYDLEITNKQIKKLYEIYINSNIDNIHNFIKIFVQYVEKNYFIDFDNFDFDDFDLYLEFYNNL